MSTPPAVPSAASAAPAAWLAQFADAVEEMLWVWDEATGRVLYANPAFERFSGMVAEGLGHGRDVMLTRIQTDDRERMRRARMQLQRAAYTEEYRITQPAMGDRPSRVARVREKAFRSPGSTSGAGVGPRCRL